MKEDKWDKEKLEKAIKESKEEFFELQRRLTNLMVDIGLRALKTFQATKSEPLNPLQINQIVTKEIQAVIKDLSKPSFMDMVIQKRARAKAEIDFIYGSPQSL